MIRAAESAWHPILAMTVHALGSLQAAEARLEVVPGYFERTIRIREARLPADRPDLLQAPGPLSPPHAYGIAQ
jgi:hypothetical protein